MRDAPRRRQNSSCDQCRAGKRRCDVTLSRHHTSTAGLDLSEEPTIDASCTNCIKWKKQCTIAWITSQEKQRWQKNKQKKRTAPPTTKTTVLAPELLCSDNDDDHHQPIFDADDVFDGAISSESDSSVFLFGSVLGDHPHPQGLGELGNPSTLPFTPWDPELLCPDLPTPVHSSFSSPPREAGIMDGTFGKLRPQCSEEALDLEESELRVVADSNSASILPSHFLAEEQYRISIREELLRIYCDGLESEMSCWFVEKNCPFDARPPEARTGWSSKRSERLVTRVCQLDDSLCATALLSKHDREQASKSLVLAMMTLAAQWAHLINGAGESRPPRHLYERKLPPGSFERGLQRALWHQASVALAEASANPSLRVIYASIIFFQTHRPPDAHDEYMPQPCRPDLVSLHKILERDTSSTYIDFAVRKLQQRQRGEMSRQARCVPSFRGGTQQLSPDDLSTYAVVFWLAIMFDSMSAPINHLSFGMEDADTNAIYKQFNRLSLAPSSTATPSDSESPSISDASSEFIHQLPSLDRSRQPHRDLDIWGDYFLSDQTHTSTVQTRSTRWPCSDEDAAVCLADGLTVLILFFRRIGHLQNLFYRDTPRIEIATAAEAALGVYHQWKNTYALFLEDCMTHHQDLSSRIQSWYVLQLSNFNLGIIILSDLMDKVSNECMTMTETEIMPLQAIYSSTALRLRAAYMMSDLGRCCANENAAMAFSESLGIHSAVEHAALLRESTPTVLTRSFIYTGEIFVRLIQTYSGGLSGTSADVAGLQDARRRLDDCIDALELLGRKSDMALCASNILRQVANPCSPA